MRGLSLIFLAGWLSGCSLLVQFDPETQPCDTRSGCLPGYACSDGGLCKSTDAGFTDGGRTDAGGCAARETVCGDRNDDDCDSLTDCADPDCGGLPCDDRIVCTTGEVCFNGTCARGNAMSCNTPPNSCHEQSGTCEPSSGGCSYTRRLDGTSCGGQAARCCAGTCFSTAEVAAHCGGCGLVCGSQERCQSLNVSTCSTDAGPTNSIGRCTCVAGACPLGQVCSSNRVCQPASNTQCAPGQSVADAGMCGLYCRYN